MTLRAAASGAAGHSADTYGVGRCGVAPDLNPSVSESFSSAPICSCEARIVLRIFWANHTPAARKANCPRRLPNEYQLFCTQVLNSFMFAPWTGQASIYGWDLLVETGRKSRKRAGLSLPPRSMQIFHAKPT